MGCPSNTRSYPTTLTVHGASRQIWIADVRLGSKADIGLPAIDVRYWSNSGHWLKLAQNGSVAIDPIATLAVHCGNGFDASFGPYQSTRLSRYDAVS